MGGVGEIAGASILLKALGIGIVPGIGLLVFLVVGAVLRFINNKQDKDRAEHMEKWNTMIATQEKMIQAQKENMAVIIEGNREDLRRAYDLYERLAKSFEATSHHVSVIASSIEHRTICPVQHKQ